MPVLHKYNESYHKSGYYVKVNWSAPHPYPLQTPAIAEQIYLELGFEPEDEIPNELTSRLFNAGLHWTEDSGAGDPAAQTDLQSITNSDLQDLDLGQLKKLYDLLDNAAKNVDIEQVEPGALDELKAELEKLQNISGDDSGENTIQSSPTPERTKVLLEEVNGGALSENNAFEIRRQAEFPKAFDLSLYQFVRKHPITPREITVNDYGDPTFRFRSGAVEWLLSDCRPKQLDFDWAITVAPDSERKYGLRISSKGIIRAVNGGEKLSEQQAADLITIVPCLLWTLDLLDDYEISDRWNGASLNTDLSSQYQEWLRDQINMTLSARNSDIASTEGVVIDYPNRYFARIRTLKRHIICVPVKSLPKSTGIGTDVSFHVTDRYGTNYATEVRTVEGATACRRGVEFTEDGESYKFEIPEPSGSGDTDVIIDAILNVFGAVSPTTALADKAVQDFVVNAQLERSEVLAVIYCLLDRTPFDPDQFPEFVADLQTHHRTPDSYFSTDLLLLALSVAFFYDEVDKQAAISELDGQGDTTVLYEGAEDVFVIGNELIQHGIGGPLRAIPEQIRKNIFEVSGPGERGSLFLKVLAALSEKQFYSSKGSLTTDVLRDGMKENNLYALYFVSRDGFK